jgi:phospholipid transport system transporter-binding protein
MTAAGDNPRARATLDLRGDTLHIAGRLQRDAVPALWSALPTAPFAQVDLSAVTALDTAGLALLVELAAHSRRAGGPSPRILHAPAGYDSLCAAYRIRPELDDALYAKPV